MRLLIIGHGKDENEMNGGETSFLTEGLYGGSA